jgi:acyl-coenzyme A thioesterase PaaI-like protein
MTWAAILGRERPCFAAEFSVRLQRPLPPGTECTAAAWVRENRRRILDTQSELRDDAGTLFAVASGRYVPIRGDRTEGLRHDFVRAPGCLPVDHFFA